MEEVYSLSVPLVVDTSIGKTGMRRTDMENLPDAWILTVGNEIINGVITDTNRRASLANSGPSG